MNKMFGRADWQVWPIAAPAASAAALDITGLREIMKNSSFRKGELKFAQSVDSTTART
jgi:hypothetical protein